MVGIICFRPLSVIVVTGGLYTGGTVAACGGAACVRGFTALGANLILLMGMCRLITGGVAVVATTAGGTASGVVRGAEVEITDLPFTDHNAGTIITGSTGVAFDGIEVCTLSVIYKTYMGHALFEEQVTLLGGIVAAVFVGQTKCAGTGSRGSLQNAGRNTGFFGTPADKHCAPGGVGKTVPHTVLGVVVAAFTIANLSQRNADDISPYLWNM